MEHTLQKTNNLKVVYSYQDPVRKWKYPLPFTIIKLPLNCKFSVIDGIQHLSTIKDSKERKQVFDDILKLNHITVHITLTDNGLRQWIKENYELYQDIEVPVGYNNTYQYHMLIKNSLSGSGNTIYLRNKT